MTGSGAIAASRPQTRRGRKSALVHLQVERWRELKVIAALTVSTLDGLVTVAVIIDPAINSGVVDSIQ